MSTRIVFGCVFFGILALTGYAFFVHVSHPANKPLQLTELAPLGKRTKTAGCQARGALPDLACTPGSIDPKVTQANIKETICVSGYTKTVRPPVSYTSPLKKKGMAAYGFTGSPSDYEFDHQIPLELGGNPTDLANLWPEPADPSPGFHEKDQVENYLNDEVCDGKISLHDAQLQIANDWLAVFRQL